MMTGVHQYSELELVQPKDALAPKEVPREGAIDSLEHHPDQAPYRKICRLSATTFFLIFALITVIMVAGIGGGVGASMAVKSAKRLNTANNTGNCENRPAITTTYTFSSPTAISSSSFATPTPGRTLLDCPNIDNTNLRITIGSKTFLFGITCGGDFGGPPGRPVDMLAIISYSLQDCAQACASYNWDFGQNICKAVTFNSDMVGSLAANFGNCFLKNGTAGETQSTYTSFAGLALK